MTTGTEISTYKQLELKVISLGAAFFLYIKPFDLMLMTIEKFNISYSGLRIQSLKF